MKKILFLLVLMCVLLSLFCGCAHEVPKFLPGEQAGDENCVWVCTEPFAFFSLDDSKIKYIGCFQGYGYIKSEEGFKDFFAMYNSIDGNTRFTFPEFWDETLDKDSLWGSAYYYKDYFDFTTEDDDINFFSGELPSLRFYKMTKEEFAKKYETLSEFVGSK